jgi:hypothetical protein
MWVYLLVEGQTEEASAKELLCPHFQALSIWLVPIVVQTSRSHDGRKHRGGGRWKHWAAGRPTCGASSSSIQERAPASLQ